MRQALVHTTSRKQLQWSSKGVVIPWNRNARDSPYTGIPPEFYASQFPIRFQAVLQLSLAHHHHCHNVNGWLERVVSWI